jgi:hypothetical protein
MFHATTCVCVQGATHKRYGLASTPLPISIRSFFLLWIVLGSPISQQVPPAVKEDPLHVCRFMHKSLYMAEVLAASARIPSLHSKKRQYSILQIVPQS